MPGVCKRRRAFNIFFLERQGTTLIPGIANRQEKASSVTLPEAHCGAAGAGWKGALLRRCLPDARQNVSGDIPGGAPVIVRNSFGTIQIPQSDYPGGVAAQ
jgi:hypothetical protein